MYHSTQEIDEAMARSAPERVMKVENPRIAQEVKILSLRATYYSLQVPHEQPIQYLSRLITVSHILKGLRCVLAAHIEEHFFSPAITVRQPTSPSTHTAKVGGSPKSPCSSDGHCSGVLRGTASRADDSGRGRKPC